jgi:hypothetical protein
MEGVSTAVCTVCGRENRGERAFCGGCGARLVRPCPTCGSVANDPDDRFCGLCGVALERGAIAPALDKAAAPAASAPPPRVSDASPRGASSDSVDRLPDVIAGGRYRVHELLGEGATKRVYRAHDTRLDRDVAAALIKSQNLDPASRQRVQREAQAMARLGDHPNIVAVYDIVDEDGRLLMISQLMSGGDLMSLLAQTVGRRIDADRAIAIALEISRALAHAHARGVVHRDLKPGNVWLTADGTAKLGDFGLAVSLDRTRLTQEGTMLGTAAYMPPEQALGHPADARSDLYSLGALLYELVTGRPPFLGDDVVAIVSQHIHTRPVAPRLHAASIPEPLERLILRLLEKDPAARPRDAVEVAALLEAVAGATASKHDESAPSTNPLDRLAQGVFVGRDAELGKLRSGLDEALGGRQRVLLVVGEPGIGKTRTCEELATLGRMRGAQLLWGRCHEGAGAPDYWPWVQILRAYVHEHDPRTLRSELGAGAGDIAEVVSAVREKLPDLGPPARLDPEESRFRFFDSVATFLRNAAAAAPLVLVLDDLHWADKASLLLLQFIASQPGPARLLILGTYRDVELGRQHPLEQTLGELARLPHCDRVLLRGLARDDVRRFLELTAGRTPPPGLVDAVERETEGNPFFVHEVVRLLQAEGRLERADDVASWSVEIPQGVRQVIGRRLSALSEACNALLASASVIGREFDLDVLSRVSEVPREQVLDLIEEAEAARILLEIKGQPDSRRFSHALVRETLYDELRTTRRVRLHRRVGEVLESLGDSVVESRLAQLAYHFCEAAPGGDVDKAVAYAERAAQRSLGLLAFEEAANHYERALSALEAREGGSDAKRCELQVLAMEALVAGGVPRANPLALEAITLARRLGEPRLFGRAVLGLGGWIGYSSPSAVDPELEALLVEAVTLLRPVDDALCSRVLARLASELFFGDQPQRRAEVVLDAVATARRSGDPAALVMALWQEVFVVERTGDLDARLRLTDEIVELARTIGDLRAEFISREARLGLLVQRGDASGIDRDLERMAVLAEEMRRPAQRSRLEVVRTGRALWRGELAEARARSWAALQIGQRLDAEGAQQSYGVHYYLRRRMEGRLGDADLISTLEAGVKRFPVAVIWRCLLVGALAEGGRADEAAPVLARLIADDVLRPERDPFLLEDLTMAADACLVVRDRAAARYLYDRLSPHAGRFACSTSLVCLGSVARSAGNMANLLGDADLAIGHLEAAIEAERGLGALGWLPRTQVDLARVMIDRGRAEDEARAVDVLIEASRTAKRLGLAGWAAMALEQRLRLRGAESDAAMTLEI